MSDETPHPPTPPLYLRRIDARMRALGMSDADLRDAAGLGSDTIRNWRSPRGDKAVRAPTLDVMLRVARALQCSVESLVSEDEPEAPPPAEARALPPAAGYRAPARRRVEAAAEMDLPVLGTAAGSAASAFVLSDGVVDYVYRPPSLRGAPDAYAVYVTGTSMAPEHNPGDLRIIHPHRPIRIGDTVIIQTQSAENAPIEAFIKKLVKISPEKVTVEQHNPQAIIDFKRSTVKSIHRVLTTSELFGV